MTTLYASSWIVWHDERTSRFLELEWTGLVGCLNKSLNVPE